jgi:hypothetical protein
VSIAVHDHRTEPLSFLARFPGVTPRAAEFALDLIYGDESVAAAVRCTLRLCSSRCTKCP